jgi:repressor LexA
MLSSLTKQQQMVLHFLEERSVSGSLPPTFREICEHFGYKSPKAATDHVAALERKGYVVREKGCARGLRLIRKSIGIPLVGRISAGIPDEVTENFDQQLALDPVSYGIRDRSKAFALRVNGDSMIGRHILDGDIVLLEQGAEPQNEDVVAALIDNESTLKTFVRSVGKIWLRAENPQFPDLLPAWDLQIQGVGRAVIRFIKK